jgi:hypothetical protein
MRNPLAVPRSLPLALLAAALLSLAGCSRGNELPVFPVRGTVFYKGKPAHRAIVWFHPEGKTDLKAHKPRAVVEPDGSFQISTYRTHDGAPAGRYRVSIYWRAQGKVGDDEGESLLPARYGDPQTSGLPPVEVKEGSNELPPFQLKG